MNTEQELQALGKTAPRITENAIEDNIASEWYFTAAQGVIGAPPSGHNDGPVPETLSLLTICVLVLVNGFSVTGTSACASPDNFDADIGRKVARRNALNHIWPLMGYELRTKLHVAEQGS